MNTLNEKFETPQKKIIIAKTCAMQGKMVQFYHELIQLTRKHNVWTWSEASENPLIIHALNHVRVKHGDDSLKDDYLIVVPPTGAPMQLKKLWKMCGHEVLDFSTDEVRRTQTTMSLFLVEGLELVILGRRGDAEVQALLGDHPRARVVENAEDAVRIPFSPAFGVVTQTSMSQTLSKQFVEIIKGRHKNCRVTFLDTSSSYENQLEKNAAKLAEQCDGLIVLGRSLSADMLERAAREKNPLVWRIQSKEKIPEALLQKCQTIALCAGSDVLPQEVTAMEKKLLGIR